MRNLTIFRAVSLGLISLAPVSLLAVPCLAEEVPERGMVRRMEEALAEARREAADSGQAMRVNLKDIARSTVPDVQIEQGADWVELKPTGSLSFAPGYQQQTQRDYGFDSPSSGSTPPVPPWVDYAFMFPPSRSQVWVRLDQAKGRFARLWFIAPE